MSVVAPTPDLNQRDRQGRARLGGASPRSRWPREARAA